MDTVSSIRGNSTNFQISPGNVPERDSSLHNEDAAVVEFSAKKIANKDVASTEQSQVESIINEAVFENLGGNSKELHDKITAAFSGLSPGISRQYKSLLASTIHHHERLSSFIEAVSKVVSHLTPDEQTTDETFQTDGSSDTPGLSIGKSLSFTVEGHLDAAFSASANGDVAVRKFALDLAYENQVKEVEVKNDPESPTEHHPAPPVAVAAYLKTAEPEVLSAHDLIV